MLDTAALAASLSGLVGYRPDPAGVIDLPEGLLESRSGLYVQDASELLTLDVLRHLVPPAEELPDWLLRLQSDALKRLAPALVAAQGLDGKVLLPATPLVKNPGNRANTVNKLGRFVGLQLKFGSSRGVTYRMPSVKIQLDGLLGEGLLLYLYSDAQPEPLATVPVAAENKPYFPFLVELPDLPAFEPDTHYWFGYYEDDLPADVRAIQAEVGPCGCSDDPYPKVRARVVPTPFSVAADHIDQWRMLFDPAYVSLESQNYGLNPTFYAYCDVVNALESDDNALRLAPVVQQAIAVRMLEAVYTSPNVTQLTGRQDVQADAAYQLFRMQAKLYGGKVPGTDEVYPSALKSLTLDLSGLCAECGVASTSLLSMGSLRP